MMKRNNRLTNVWDSTAANAAAPPPTEPLTIYCDGAVLGNPGGPGGWGFVALADGQTIQRAHGALRDHSNNEAEYQAIIRALTWLGESGHGAAVVRSDSQLAINQLTGKWACRRAHLWALRGQCLRLVESAGLRVTFEWVPREINAEADLEAARGASEALGVGEEDAQFVLEAQRKKYRHLKANKKAKSGCLKRRRPSKLARREVTNDQYTNT